MSFLLRVSIQGADPGFVVPEAYTISRAVFKKNIKLWTKNVQKWIFIYGPS